jgi:hypothetical protein
MRLSRGWALVSRKVNRENVRRIFLLLMGVNKKIEDALRRERRDMKSTFRYTLRDRRG